MSSKGFKISPHQQREDLKAICGTDHDPATLKFLKIFWEGKEQNVPQTKVQRFAKDKRKNMQGGDYSINFRFGGHRYYFKGSYPERKVYSDGAYQMILDKGEGYIANLGFDLLSNGLEIIQIQGVKGTQKDLRQIRWQNMLVNFLEEIIMRIDSITDLCILPADRNIWKHRLNLERAKTHYDGTAKGCGFEYDPGKKLWVKNLRN